MHVYYIIYSKHLHFELFYSDEYDFLPVLEPKHNRSPLILQDHKLGLEMWSVKILHHYAYNTLMTWRMKEVNAKFLGKTTLNFISVFASRKSNIISNQNKSQCQMHSLHACLDITFFGFTHK